MDPILARTRLAYMTAASEEPVLVEAELDDLLEQYALIDIEGREPTDPDWEGTWNLRNAAAEGWRWKAARVANQFDFTTDGGMSNIKRGQLHAHCLKMVEMYASGNAGTLEYGGVRTWDPVIGNLG